MTTSRELIEAGDRRLQICYHPDRLEAFVGTLHAQGLTERAAILPAIVLVRGPRPLAFMDREVPGIDVPAETIARIEEADDPAEAAYQLGLEQARHALSLPGVRALHLTDFRHDGSLSRLCNDLDIAPKEERRSDAHRSHVPV
jgi:methylenetetrahydrofolate reductase (NADPH)